MAEKTGIPTQTPESELDSLSLYVDGREFKVYSEKALQRKIRDEERRLRSEVIIDFGLASEAIEYLILARLREMLAVPGLTRQERRALLLEGTGHNPPESARILRVRIGRYRRLLASARKKVEEHKGSPYAGWYEVYLAEVNRYVYRKPR